MRPEPRRGGAISDPTAPPHPRRLPGPALLALGLLCTALSLGIALGPLDGVPHVTDEIAYTLQARLFAAGERAGPGAAYPALQSFPFWQTEGLSHAVFPPGWPALLALGERVGWGVLVNPLLAMGLPAVAFALGRHWLEERGAWAAALVMALSPGVLLLSSSRMAHTSVLLALGLAALAVARPGRRGWAGLAVAYVVLARPYDAVLLGIPILLWGIAGGRRGERAALVLIPGAAAGLVLLDNQFLTGSAVTFPVGPWFDQWVEELGRPPGCNRLGFGETIGCAPVDGSWGHSPGKALGIMRDTAIRMDRLMFGIPGGTLILVVGALRLGRRGVLLLLPVPLIVLGYGLYWSPGLALGARFWHPLYLVLPVLVGAAVEVLPTRGLPRWLVPAGLAVACLGGTSRLLPELASSWWCVDGRLSSVLADADADSGVLFVRSEGEPIVRTWPRLGVDRPLECAAMLASGDAFLLHDPTGAGLQPGGTGLTVRHAPPPAQITRWRREQAPEAPAWLAVQDLGTGSWSVGRLPPLAPDQRAAAPPTDLDPGPDPSPDPDPDPDPTGTTAPESVAP